MTGMVGNSQDIRREIWGLVFTAAGVFCVISLHSQTAGEVGKAVASGLRWLAGEGADIPAALVVLFGLRLVLPRRKRTVNHARMVGILGLTISVLVFLELFRAKSLEVSALSASWTSLATGEGIRYGGGAVGAAFSMVFVNAFGDLGTYLFVFTLAIISTVLIAGVSFGGAVYGIARLIVRALRFLFAALYDFIAGLIMEILELVRFMIDRRAIERRSKRQRVVRERVAHDPAGDELPAETGRGGYPPGGSGLEAGEEQDIPRPVRSVPGHAAGFEPLEPVDADQNPSYGREEIEAAPPMLRTQKMQPAGQIDLISVTRDPDLEHDFDLPPTGLLRRPSQRRRSKRGSQINEDQSEVLEKTLASFGIQARVVNANSGPAVTRYELELAPGIKVSRITGLADDIALALAAAGVRIEAPVPGKSVVGIEVPNKETSFVYLREVLESDEFKSSRSKLTIALGKDIAGNPVVADLTKLLHLLIAGATGSGKSVCLNSIIASLLFKARPDELKFVMVDPKRVELTTFDGIPHLLAPVVTDPRKAAGALKWVVKEMEDRYKLFADSGVRNIDRYNEMIDFTRADNKPGGARTQQESQESGDDAPKREKLPYIVVIIDELADLMMVAPADVEDAIARLAQMARAAGIFLIIATQRPSVDVITGVIKANIPSRIAFAVSSQVDSRTILDMSGAERLLGKGDMLFHPIGAPKPIRAQGALVFDKDIEALVEFLKNQASPELVDVLDVEHDLEQEESMDDELFPDAVRLIVNSGQASISMLQRRFRIGYSRAARLIDMMELKGIVGPYQGSKPREVLVDEDQIEELI